MSHNATNKPYRVFIKNLFSMTRSYLRTMKAIYLAEETNSSLLEVFFLSFIFPIVIILLPLVDLFLLPFLPGLHIFRPMFKAGWKYALITSIGVSLAVSIITQYVFFIYSYQYRAFDLYLIDEPRTYIQVDAEGVTIDPEFPQYHYFGRVADLAFNELNVSDYFLQKDVFFKRGTFTKDLDPLTGESSLPNAPLIGTESKLYNFIVNNLELGSAPSTYGDVIALMPSSYYNHSSIRVGSSVSLYIPISLDKSASLVNPDAQTKANVTGILFLDKIPNYTIAGSDKTIPLKDLLELSGNIAFVSNWIIAGTILENILLTFRVAEIFADLFYDVTKIDTFHLKEEITRIKQIGVTLREWYYKLGYDQVDINSYLVDLLEKFRDEYNLYQIFMFSFLGPIIALTVILTVYAANLVRKKRERQLTILSERGITRSEVGSYLALESIIMGLFALIAGIVLGVPLASLLTKSSGFLTFNNSIISLQLNLSSVITALIGSVGAIFFIQLFNILTLLKRRSSEDYGQIEKSLPGLYSYYLDLILLTFGILLWIIYQLPALSSFKDLTAKFIGIPSVFLVLFGGTLAFQRLLPLFGKLITIFGTKIRRYIFTLATKELYRYQSSFSRSSIILVLSFSLVFSSIVVPSTYQNFNISGAYYDVGADMTIRNFPLENQLLIEQVQNLSSVEAVSKVMFVNLIDVTGDLVISYSVLMIDPETYIDVAYFSENYASEPLQGLLNKLQSPNDVLIQKDELEVMDGKVGAPLEITYRGYNETKRQYEGTPFFYTNVTTNVVGTFKYWPTLVTEISTENVRHVVYHVVARLDFLNYLEIAPFDIISYLYIKLKPNIDVDAAAKQISDLVGMTITRADEEVFVKPGTARSTILYSAINSTLIMAFTINAIILALFASIQLINKSRSIATMKAIGITTKQLLSYFLALYLSLLLFSVIAGIIVGLVSSNMLMAILSITRSIPPYTMFYPIKWLVIVIVALAGTSVTGAITPVVGTLKAEIGSELRQSS